MTAPPQTYRISLTQQNMAKAVTTSIAQLYSNNARLEVRMTATEQQQWSFREAGTGKNRLTERPSS